MRSDYDQLTVKTKHFRATRRLASCGTLGRVVALLSLMCGATINPLAADPADNINIPNILVTEQRDQQSAPLLASKVKLPANDLPISAERLNADLIERTGFTILGQLLQAVSSAAATPTDGGGFNEILLRGFADAPIYRNGINDAYGRLPLRSLANISHVEILKGPYGALYGPGEPGGSINFVTKKPRSTSATEISLGFASYNELNAQLDSTGPLSRTANVDYRFIARREQSDTFRDFVKNDRLFVNPMLRWIINPTIRIEGSFEYISDERLLDSGVASINGALPLPHDRFLGEPSSGTAAIEGYTFQLSSIIDLDSNWQLDLSINGQKTSFKGDLVEPDGLETTPNGVSLNRSATHSNEQSKALIFQTEASGIALGWGVPHHLLVGISATGANDNVVFSASDADDDPFVIDPISPVYGTATPLSLVERDSVEHTRQFSIYVQDLVRLGARWRLMLGLRFDHIDQAGSDGATNSRFSRVSHELSPRIGIVYKASNSWSWFASYSRSIDPNEGLRPDGSGLAPTDSEAMEAGLKWQSERFPIAIDTSVYAMQQTDVTTEAPGDPGFELQTGEQESIGFDFEMRADPGPWLSLIARYNFVDAQILEDSILSDGTTPLNVAKHNMGVTALVKSSLVKPDDISLGLSFTYASDRQASLEPNELSLKLPSYIRGDLFVMWRYSENLRFEFGIENFTDEDYIRSSQSDALHLTPGTPLSARGQVTLSF